MILIHGKTGSRWMLRFASPVTGKRRDAGLGVYPEVSIADAREKASAMRRVIDGGSDPIEVRNREREAASVTAAALTFEKAARTVHDDLKSGWRNEKHAARLKPMCSRNSARNGRCDHARRLRGRAAPHLA